MPWSLTPSDEVEEARQLLEALRISQDDEGEPAPDAAAAAAPAAAASSEAPPASPKEEPQDPPAKAPPARAPRAARAQRREDWAYAVWVIPAHPEQRGVHCGGGRAWAGLVPSLSGRYSYFRGHRLRRYASREAALEGYEAEAARHEAPLPPPVFEH